MALKWSNLKDGKCPKCELMLKQDGGMLYCSCDFKISAKKLIDIINPKEKQQTEDERRAELNSMGQDVLTDFDEDVENEDIES